MTRWTDSLTRTLSGALYQGKHRPRVTVDPEQILDDYCDDFGRHVTDGRTVDDALTLAEIDASDRMTIAEVAS